MTSDQKMVVGILILLAALLVLMIVGVTYFIVKSSKEASKAPLEDGENLLATVPANHLEGLISHGGTLRVTTRRLVFTPHGLNFKRIPITISWENVEGIAMGATTEFALLKAAALALSRQSTGSSDVLRIRHKGAETRFVIWPNKQLLEGMKAAIAATQGTPSLS